MYTLIADKLKSRNTVTAVSVTDSLIVVGYGTVTQDLAVEGDLNVTGDLVYDEATAVNLKISGIGTIGTLGVSGVTTSASAVVGAAVTINSTGIHAGAGIITATTGSYSGTVTANAFSGDGGDLTGLNIPAGFTELDAALFN